MNILKEQTYSINIAILNFKKNCFISLRLKPLNATMLVQAISSSHLTFFVVDELLNIIIKLCLLFNTIGSMY